VSFIFPPNNRGLSDSELLADPRRVASDLSKNTLTYDEYDKHGVVGASCIQRRFGSWLQAIGKAGLGRSRGFRFRDEDLFENLEKIWVSLGRSPRHDEVRKPLSRYTANTYCNRFGSCRKTLERFVEFVNSDESTVSPTPIVKLRPTEIPIAKPANCDKDAARRPSVDVAGTVSSSSGRSANLRLRFKVMQRDHFKCCACGRSPSTDPSVVLHIDHVKPWSKEGKTVMENLQTLCQQCNLGKSNLINE
jgi:HNH endonuclease/Homing endonuclease associated repeat